MYLQGVCGENGLSENRVEILKQTLALSLNYAELQTLVVNILNTMKDRPVGGKF